MRIFKFRDGNIGTTVEAAVCQKQNYEEDINTLAGNAERVIEQMIVTRLTHGARIAALMLQRAVDDGEVIGVRQLEVVATQLNCQWVIAI